MLVIPSTCCVRGRSSVSSDSGMLADSSETKSLKDHINTSYPSISEPDNPIFVKPHPQQSDDVYHAMKKEINRYTSFGDKWPLSYISKDDLAQNGFFYLQKEDYVQCAFCKVMLKDWNVGDKPLREHLKASEQCTLLMHRQLSGDIPMSASERRRILCSSTKSEACYPREPFRVDTANVRPKNPGMSDVNKRLLTYRSWPLVSFTPNDLADCGLYYTGVSDVVTCFFCGGSLGNWDLNDDPWDEHKKFFPKCGYLHLIQIHGKPKQSTSQQSSSFSRFLSAPLLDENSSSIGHDVVGSVAMMSVSTPSSANTQKVTNAPVKADSDLSGLKLQCASDAFSTSDVQQDPKSFKDTFLCKICMDREMGIVFQPCGHLVSCPNCAAVLSECPMCRTPIVGKVRTYLS